MEIQRICDKKYLLIPIAAQQPLKILEVYADGKKIYEFQVPASEDTGHCGFHYYAPLPLGQYGGSVIALKGDFEESFFDAISFSDSLPEKVGSRPAVHFSANTGWVNDPNGFFYQDGVYHLYFQHNPMDTLWGNMCWGHAVSGDLLHWEQRETVMCPDEDGTIFSGCAVVNERALLDLPTGYPVFFYTSAGDTSRWSAGKKFVQKIAFSPDGGDTLVKTGRTALPHIAGENRDPKVYWHEESNGYYMVLYLEKNEFAVLRSENLADWIITQRLVLEDAWECPDLVRVPVEGGGSRWVFWCADGFYFIGDFDGYTFTQTGKKMRAYASVLPYAAQTCWGSDRVISIPWLRSENKNAAYTGVMGVPRELTLSEESGILRLRQRFVRELSACRRKVDGCGQKEGAALYRCDARQAAELVVFLQDDESIEATFDRTKIRYDSAGRTLSVCGCLMQSGERNWRKEEITRLSGEGCIKEVKFEEPFRKMSLLVDHEILEVTLDDGLVCAYFEIMHEDENQMMDVTIDTEGAFELYQIC